MPYAHDETSPVVPPGPLFVLLAPSVMPDRPAARRPGRFYEPAFTALELPRARWAIH
jgi:hypothetical protein